MAQIQLTQPLAPGDRAPDLTVPAVMQDRVITLADYHGRAPVLVGLFRGLYCAFCRRQVASLGLTAQKLLPLGVETLAIVATPAERARLYFRFRPPRCLVGADPEATTHRAFGVPRSPITDEIMRMVRSRGDELAREVGLDISPDRGLEALDRHDGIDSAAHAQDLELHQAQFSAQFLIDRDGVIRWANVECAREGLAGLERFPSEEEFLAAARAL
jgi:peroxiredoxin